MVEIELKFQVPMIHRVDVSQVFHNKNAQPIHVKTQYYDTAECKLSAAKLQLQLVLQANHWIQTLICEDAKHLGYLEHQVSLGKPMLHMWMLHCIRGRQQVRFCLKFWVMKRRH
jgi:hypothetical protein